MPGVYVTTGTRTGPANEQGPDSGQYFVAGLTQRGPLTPVLCRSFADYVAAFGDRVAFGAVYDDVRTFFEEGGARAWVSRVVGPAATAGTLALKDGAAATQLTLTAREVGSWSTDLRAAVTVAAGPVLTVTITSTRYGSRSYSGATAGALATAINAADLEVTATATAPGTGVLVAAASTAFSAGSDDSAGVTATVLATGLTRFGPELGAGAAGTPGFDADVVIPQIATWLKAAGGRRIFIGMVSYTSPSTGSTAAIAAAAAAGVGEYVGAAYQRIIVPVGNGTTRTITPEGYIAACRARTHRDVGPWAVPAGDVAVARFVSGVETVYTRAQVDDFNDNGRLIGLVVIGGALRVYGWRSLSADVVNYRLLNGRDVLNTIAAAADSLLERHVFKTVDAAGRRIAAVAADLIGLLEPYRVAGGLYENRDPSGNLIDPGYSVDVSPAVNTTALLAQDTISAVVAVRVSPVGEKIALTIVKAGLTATV